MSLDLENGRLHTRLVERAEKRSGGTLRSVDLLAAAIDSDHTAFRQAFAEFLAPGVTVARVRALIDLYWPACISEFSGRLAQKSPSTCDLSEALDCVKQDDDVDACRTSLEMLIRLIGKSAASDLGLVLPSTVTIPPKVRPVDPRRPLPPGLDLSGVKHAGSMAATSQPMPETEMSAYGIGIERVGPSQRPHSVNPAGWAGCYEAVARTLYSTTKRHAIVTGERGVGKSHFMRSFAESEARKYAFLQDADFYWIDCDDADTGQSLQVLDNLGRQTIAGRRCVLCIDNLARLLQDEQRGPLGRPLFSQLKRRGWLMIGTLSLPDFRECIASDASLLRNVRCIEVPEPSESEIEEIVAAVARDLEASQGIKFDSDALRTALQLSQSYVFDEQRPGSALRLLREACDEAAFETDFGSRDERIVRAADIARVVSRETSIPAATLEGASPTIDFQTTLARSVMGQLKAIQTVAYELRAIQAGLTEPDRPASVMLFAGMTGVGKTELAKQIAKIYSPTRSLHTYSMGNFTEPHSVSGIIGVPPGYVGHEHGGRLINELNADPYSVFLLDEAEKAHPNVWKPFLNLFDEGWIVDQRGVKARADRAIFILTTNAGDRTVAQLVRTGKPENEIADAVKNALERVRPERGAQPVFTAHFLARIKQIVVFRPLDEEAMEGICQLQLDRLSALWLQRRGIEVQVDNAVVELIAARAHRVNEKSGGKEGGRIVRKLIAEVVERPLYDGHIGSTHTDSNVLRIGLSHAGGLRNCEGLSDDELLARVTFRDVVI